MSYFKQRGQAAWETAFWWFAGQDYTTDQCDAFAKQFVKEALENPDIDLDYLLVQFVSDVQFAEGAEADKEASRYA